MSYRRRFAYQGELNDLEKAIEHLSRVLELTPNAHPRLLLPVHGELGKSHQHRYLRLGELSDLDKTIKHLSRVLELTSDDDPRLPTLRGNLGVFYKDRFKRLGELDDLDKATKHLYRALELSYGIPEYLVPHYHNILGELYSLRFERLDALEDLERAIEHETRALELALDDHPKLYNYHAALGVSYYQRFERLDKLDDLQNALKHHSSALELASDGHPRLPHLHGNLGLLYKDLFKRLGELNDLERAIEHETHALELTPDGHLDLILRHVCLGLSYTHRFERLDDLDDLERAIEHETHALELTPDGHPNLSSRHTSLGTYYIHRFERLDELDDLEKAIKHQSRALELIPDGDQNLIFRHVYLGRFYVHLFERLDEPDILETAINHFSHALELIHDVRPDLPDRRTKLGLSHADQSQQLEELDDVVKEIERALHVLESIPGLHLDLSKRRFTQAEIFISWYQHTTNPSHLTDSLDFFRKVTQLSTGPPRDQFRRALRWASVASNHCPQSPSCIDAYQTAINLLSQFIWLNEPSDQQFSDLLTANTLAVNAANVAILHSNYGLALEWLEHARCVIWNQSLILRSPVDELYSSHSDLATRLLTVSEQLHSARSVPQSTPPISAGLVADSQDCYRLAGEYDGLLAQIRTLTGYADFLLPMEANHLVLAARTGPVALINCHIDHCDALLILPGQHEVNHLPLRGFTEENARSARSELELALRCQGPIAGEREVKVKEGLESRHNIGSVLASLWHHIIKPVLDFLGYTVRITDENRSHVAHTALQSNHWSADLPHITWCPTGTLSFLPLHAAGDYDQPGSRVFDYVISSYTSTLTALLASVPTSLNRSSRVLAIGQAHTPGHSPLPGTTTELKCVKAHTKNRVEYSQLTGDQATMKAVLDAMEDHDWVHLACHAHQNVQDPTKSGFYLHDGTLDLASINRRSFRNKGLAFLSACQTAMGDEKLPNEAIHLASGMLMAGYPSVIATMWSVVDSDAPFVADIVYAELMKEGKVGNGEAGEALHHAVAALREKVGEKSFERWVPYIHIGS